MFFLLILQKDLHRCNYLAHIAVVFLYVRVCILSLLSKIRIHGPTASAVFGRIVDYAVVKCVFKYACVVCSASLDESQKKKKS